jgi:hypothetical protein
MNESSTDTIHWNKEITRYELYHPHPPFSIDRCMWQLTFKVSMDDVIYHQLGQNDLEGLLNRAKYSTRDWYEPIQKLISDTLACDVPAH